ncbi:unnamed protein product [Calicophoron daubneyi]|uniref:Armadillo repeat-containing domain-containing protein n=1 Tax=Calicophoron daubneyi TaxID=300641 RepID=A0AAV2TQ83_CALDB
MGFRKLAISASCSLAAASLAAFIIYRQLGKSRCDARSKLKLEESLEENIYSRTSTRSPRENGGPPHITAKVWDPPSWLVNFAKEDLTMEVACGIVTALNSFDTPARQGPLLMLQQASTFSSNGPVFRDSGCLSLILGLLDSKDQASITTRQNLTILQTVTNLACDRANLPCIQEHLRTILEIANTQNYSDQACAALQLLCNVALTPDGCRILDNKIELLYGMLSTRDPYILRQVYSILVNLSCDAASSLLLLQSLAPPDLFDALSYSLSNAVQPLVSLQAVMFLKNSYTAMRIQDAITDDMRISDLLPDRPSDAQTVADFLTKSRGELKLRLYVLLSETPTSEVGEELTEQASLLCEILDTQHSLPKNGRPETR